MPSYKIFLKAPSAAELERTERTGTDFSWHTIEGLLVPNNESNTSINLEQSSGGNLQRHEIPSFLLPLDSSDKTREWLIPPASMDIATQRMSEMYKNAIFAEDDDDEDSFALGNEKTDPSQSRIDITGNYPPRLKLNSFAKIDL